MKISVSQGLGLLFSLILFLFLSSSLFAQGATVGIEGGTGFASIENSNGSILGQINGLSAGAFCSLRLDDDFAIEPECLYVEKGGSTIGGASTFSVNYLEIPVLVKWYLLKTLFNPAIFAGPFYSANVSSAVRNGLLTNINPSDLGGTVGVELSLDNIYLTARWDISLTQITSDSVTQNRDFILMLGLGI